MSDAYCEVFAAVGYCTLPSVAWVKVLCRKSCGTCDLPHALGRSAVDTLPPIDETGLRQIPADLEVAVHALVKRAAVGGAAGASTATLDGDNGGLAITDPPQGGLSLTMVGIFAGASVLLVVSMLLSWSARSRGHLPCVRVKRSWDGVHPSSPGARQEQRISLSVQESAPQSHELAHMDPDKALAPPANIPTLMAINTQMADSI